jgi:acyloxyacyl hydrolase
MEALERKENHHAPPPPAPPQQLRAAAVKKAGGAAPGNTKIAIMLKRYACSAVISIFFAAILVESVPLRSPAYRATLDGTSSPQLTIPALFLKAMFGIHSAQPLKSSNTPCAVCSPALGLLVELADVNNVTVTDLMGDICSYFPAPISAYCDSVVKTYGPDVLHYLDEKLSPDEVCYKLSLCTNAQCRLWPAKATRPLSSIVQLPPPRAAQVGETPWQWLLDQINRVANSHEPLVDLDHDLHSTEMTLRGGNWRGRDCDDFDGNIHPGRRESGSHPMTDENCNGISGINKDSGNSWEVELCNGTDAKGVVVLGDSAGAHFHIPVNWLNPHAINKTTYSELVFALANEMDWPQRSATSGFIADDHDDPGPMSSIYAAMRDRNRCNHRDYHNIAVNGARASDMNSTIIRSFQRSQELDKPVLVSFALIGNDVCNGHPDYYNHMTKPEDFYNSVVASLEYLDTVLPMGSHVMLVGLAHGSVLYDTMHNRTHPVGTQYENLYDWLNCLEMSPCLVWMNNNETIRNIGDTRAAELNAQ